MTSEYLGFEYEPVTETHDCSNCGDAIAGYANDGALLFDTDYCKHHNICRECELELHSGCQECDLERREIRLEQQAEYDREERA